VFQNSIAGVGVHDAHHGSDTGRYVERMTHTEMLTYALPADQRHTEHDPRVRSHNPESDTRPEQLASSESGHGETTASVHKALVEIRPLGFRECIPSLAIEEALDEECTTDDGSGSDCESSPTLSNLASGERRGTARVEASKSRQGHWHECICGSFRQGFEDIGTERRE
jgi:hypothetical protein